MEQATILKNGTVVRTTNFTSLEFSKSGHLSSFKVIDIVYRHFINKIDNKIYEGYFEKESYLELKAKNVDSNNFDMSSIPKYVDWEKAVDGDEIFIQKREIKYVGQTMISDNKFCVNDYELTYNSGIHIFSEKKINISAFNLVNESCSNSLSGLSPLTPAAEQYFRNNIIKSNLNDDDFIEIVGDITSLIHRIDEEIYQAFNSADFEDSLKQKQRVRWEAAYDLTITPTYENLKSYYKAYYIDLYHYYELVSNYFNYIDDVEDGIDLTKAIVLAASLHPIILQDLSLTKKIAMLQFIAKTYLIKKEKKFESFDLVSGSDDTGFLSKPTMQKFLVNLTFSFGQDDLTLNENGNSNVDLFLMELLKTRKDVTISKETPTLFELIYKNLNQPFNITEGITTISNWMFGTDFKPNTTRAAFVYGLYFLWQNSKFNPYTVNGDLKPQTLGFKLLDNTTSSIAYFNNENDSVNQNCLFYYSNEIAYQKYINEFSVILFSVVYEDASPMVIPYESNKQIGVFRDNFKFSFEQNKIIAYKDIWREQNYLMKQEYIKYGTYDIYQPVTLINTNLDTKAPIVTTTGTATEINGNTINSFIPIFVLKYIDDAGDQSDAETMLGYLVDGVLTFSGFGNLAKLKHLRWAALGENAIGLFTKQGIRVVFNGIEFTAGVVGFFANFVSCDEPTVPDTPANATVWDKYRFCQSMQTFITIFQLATLSITVGDSLASLALRKQAARVIESAGGGIDDVSIKNNLVNKLEDVNSSEASQQSIENVADKITDIGIGKYLNLVDDFLVEINKIYNKIQPKVLKRIDESNGVFKSKFFNENFHNNNFKIIIQDFIQNGINDEKTIEDFITFACRVDQKVLNPVTKEVVGKIIKGYTFNESRIIINYYAKVILKRGFVTGFYDLQDYKLFSNKAKIFLDDFCQKRGISNVTYDVQGSVQFKSHHLDPNLDDVPVLTREGNIVEPDDFDGRMYMSKHQANKYLKGLQEDYRKQLRLENPAWTSKMIEDEVNEILIDVKKGINKGMIRKDYIKPDGFLDDLKQAVKRDDGTDIFYPVNSEGVSEVGFSIIIKGSPYDIDPVMPLKY